MGASGQERGSALSSDSRPTRDVKNRATEAGLLLGNFTITLEWGQSFLLMSPKPGLGKKKREITQPPNHSPVPQGPAPEGRLLTLSEHRALVEAGEGALTGEQEPQRASDVGGSGRGRGLHRLRSPPCLTERGQWCTEGPFLPGLPDHRGCVSPPHSLPAGWDTLHPHTGPPRP